MDQVLIAQKLASLKKQLRKKERKLTQLERIATAKDHVKTKLKEQTTGIICTVRDGTLPVVQHGHDNTANRDTDSLGGKEHKEDSCSQSNSLTSTLTESVSTANKCSQNKIEPHEKTKELVASCTSSHSVNDSQHTHTIDIAEETKNQLESLCFSEDSEKERIGQSQLKTGIEFCGLSSSISHQNILYDGRPNGRKCPLEISVAQETESPDDCGNLRSVCDSHMNSQRTTTSTCTKHVSIMCGLTERDSQVDDKQQRSYNDKKGPEFVRDVIATDCSSSVCHNFTVDSVQSSLSSSQSPSLDSNLSTGTAITENESDNQECTVSIQRRLSLRRKRRKHKAPPISTTNVATKDHLSHEESIVFVAEKLSDIKANLCKEDVVNVKEGDYFIDDDQTSFFSTLHPKDHCGTDPDKHHTECTTSCGIIEASVKDIVKEQEITRLPNPNLSASSLSLDIELSDVQKNYSEIPFSSVSDSQGNSLSSQETINSESTCSEPVTRKRKRISRKCEYLCLEPRKSARYIPSADSDTSSAYYSPIQRESSSVPLKNKSTMNEESLLVSSVFQYLVDEGKRDNNSRDFELSDTYSMLFSSQGSWDDDEACFSGTDIRSVVPVPQHVDDRSNVESSVVIESDVHEQSPNLDNKFILEKKDLVSLSMLGINPVDNANPRVNSSHFDEVVHQPPVADPPKSMDSTINNNNTNFINGVYAFQCGLKLPSNIIGSVRNLKIVTVVHGERTHDFIAVSTGSSLLIFHCNDSMSWECIHHTDFPDENLIEYISTIASKTFGLFLMHGPKLVDDQVKVYICDPSQASVKVIKQTIICDFIIPITADDIITCSHVSDQSILTKYRLLVDQGILCWKQSLPRVSAVISCLSGIDGLPSALVGLSIPSIYIWNHDSGVLLKKLDCSFALSKETFLSKCFNIKGYIVLQCFNVSARDGPGSLIAVNPCNNSVKQICQYNKPPNSTTAPCNVLLHVATDGAIMQALDNNNQLWIWNTFTGSIIDVCRDNQHLFDDRMSISVSHDSECLHVYKRCC